MQALATEEMTEADIEALLELSAKVDAALSTTSLSDPDVEGTAKPKRKTPARAKKEPVPVRDNTIIAAQANAIAMLTADLNFVAGLIAEATGLELYKAMGAITNRTLTITTEEV